MEAKKGSKLTIAFMALFFLITYTLTPGSNLDKIANSFNLFTYVLWLDLLILSVSLFFLKWATKNRSGKMKEGSIIKAQESFPKFYKRITLTLSGIVLFTIITPHNILNTEILFLISMFGFMLFFKKKEANQIPQTN